MKDQISTNYKLLFYCRAIDPRAKIPYIYPKKGGLDLLIFLNNFFGRSFKNRSIVINHQSSIVKAGLVLCIDYELIGHEENLSATFFFPGVKDNLKIKPYDAKEVNHKNKEFLKLYYSLELNEAY
jgi:hypothetical protein